VWATLLLSQLREALEGKKQDTEEQDNPQEDCPLGDAQPALSA
jgi:hypothetical protein